MASDAFDTLRDALMSRPKEVARALAEDPDPDDGVKGADMVSTTGRHPLTPPGTPAPGASPEASVRGPEGSPASPPRAADADALALGESPGLGCSALCRRFGDCWAAALRSDNYVVRRRGLSLLAGVLHHPAYIAAGVADRLADRPDVLVPLMTLMRHPAARVAAAATRAFFGVLRRACPRAAQRAEDRAARDAGLGETGSEDEEEDDDDGDNDGGGSEGGEVHGGRPPLARRTPEYALRDPAVRAVLSRNRARLIAFVLAARPAPGDLQGGAVLGGGPGAWRGTGEDDGGEDGGEGGGRGGGAPAAAGSAFAPRAGGEGPGVAAARPWGRLSDLEQWGVERAVGLACCTALPEEGEEVPAPTEAGPAGASRPHSPRGS